MKCTVYRSLDKPSAFFGIRGQFVTWFAVILGAVLFLALIVGVTVDAIVAIVVFVAGGGSDYLFIMNLQGKSSDRALSIRMNSRRYPRFFRVPPKSMGHILEEINR
jgi:hypothetical protein